MTEDPKTPSAEGARTVHWRSSRWAKWNVPAHCGEMNSWEEATDQPAAVTCQRCVQLLASEEAS